jgi:prepilin-type N-terminal cleavage/methylation domain-containing protein
MIIPPRSHRRRGFTLTEMLVVIGIIAVVASITLVMLGKARRSANRSQLAFQLQSLSVGLQAYQSDFNSLPITTVDPVGTSPTATTYFVNQDGVRGARLLCKALLAPQGPANPVPATVGGSYPLTGQHQDGKSGLGFAVAGRSGVTVTADSAGNLKGKTYGPYLAPDKFQMSNTDNAGKTGAASLLTTEKYDDTAVILDANGYPILYYPVLNPSAPPTIEYAYVSRGTHIDADVTSAPETSAGTYAGTPMYNSTDNGAWLSSSELRYRLGDVGDATGPKTDPTTKKPAPNAKIDPNEQPAVRGKYILWSCGPDSVYGTNPAPEGKDRGAFDDVTNFQGD